MIKVKKYMIYRCAVFFVGLFLCLISVSQNSFAQRDARATSFTKQDCAFEFNKFVSTLHFYRQGLPVNDVAEYKINREPYEALYKEFRAGVTPATLSHMKAFSACMEKSKKHEDPSKEYDMALELNGCKTLNDVLLGTLESVKRRYKLDTVLNRYQRAKIDLSETVHENVRDPQVYFPAVVYDHAKKQGMDAGVRHALEIVAGCTA